MSKQPNVRWNESARVFFVDFGNARFAVTPKAAFDLADALIRGVGEKIKDGTVRITDDAGGAGQ